ncbi:unnamed protein product, partial [Oppiella nova]
KILLQVVLNLLTKNNGGNGLSIPNPCPSCSCKNCQQLSAETAAGVATGAKLADPIGQLANAIVGVEQWKLDLLKQKINADARLINSKINFDLNLIKSNLNLKQSIINSIANSVNGVNKQNDQEQINKNHDLDKQPISGQQHLQYTGATGDDTRPKITDSEALIWSHKNANSEYINANNCLQIIIDLCTCAAKDMDLTKVIRSQIDIISNQLSHKSYQSLIHSSNESNSSIGSSSDEEVAKCRDNEIENLRNTQNLLRKKYKLLCLLRSELANSRCQCLSKSPSNGNVLAHLRKSELNSRMWFRQIRLIETKMECKRLSLPFDVIKVMRQLFKTNDNNFNANPMPITSLDYNNNNSNNNHHIIDKSHNNCVKNEKFSPNEESGADGLGANGYDDSAGYHTNEYENENSLSKSTKNMQILRFDSLLSVSETEEPALILQPINGNDMNVDMTPNMVEMDCEGRTFQELHPINSHEVALNYTAHDISIMRSSATVVASGVEHQEFDYRDSSAEGTDTTGAAHYSNDLLPQMTAIEIDQILNN